MRPARSILIIVWCVAVGIPLVALLVELFREPAAWQAWTEWKRLVSIIKNTSLLVAGVLAICIPMGTLLALLLFRSDLPGRVTCRRILVLALFIPLPVLASAWQATLGSDGWLTLPGWQTTDPSDPDFKTTGIPWKPWATGLPAAIWIHALAALPWFVWLAGLGVSAVERDVEEDAILHGGVWAAIRHVTIPRALPAISVAALWITLSTAGEVTVTDMVQVRTLAEEVYIQISRPDLPTAGHNSSGVARALVVAVPPLLVLAIAIALWVRRLRKHLPPLLSNSSPNVLIRLGIARLPALILVVGLLALVLGVPIFSLILRSGNLPPDNELSLTRFAGSMQHAWISQQELIARSLVSAFVVGIALSAFGVASCWIGRKNPLLGHVIFVVAVIIAVLPGPVIGIALKESIQWIIDCETRLSRGQVTVLDRALYSGPSPLPVFWAACLHFLPLALALLWPAARSVPNEQVEQAAMDSGRLSQEFRLVVAPAMLAPALLTACALAAMSLGELSAGKLVEVPGGQTFAHEVFQQMHYGVGNHLAALCLLLLAQVAVFGGLALLTLKVLRRLRFVTPMTGTPPKAT